MRSVEKAFDKLDKDMKKKEREAKRRRNKDLWAALASLGAVMLLALAIAWLKSGESVVREIMGEDVVRAKQVYETTRNVLFGAGFLSIIVVVIYIIKRIKYREPATATEAFIDYDRLDAARARVERARMEQADEESYGTYRSRHAGRYNDQDDIPRSKRPEGISDEEYKRMRQEEYERYMSMDFEDDELPKKRGYGIDEENPELVEELTRMEKLKEYIAERKLIFGIGACVAVVGIAMIIVLLIVL